MKRVTRPPTLVAEAARSIRQEIMRGSLQPGEPLREIDLCKSLDISRGSVREALRMLQQEGLVDVIPYRGAFVARLTTKKAREIYTLRALLEPYAVRMAVENRDFTDKDLAKMKDMVRKLRDYEERQDYVQMIQTDMQFHELISRYCQHDLLIDVLLNLQSLTQVFMLNTKIYRSDMVPDDVSHQSILDGILSGDPEVAEQVVRQHIQEAGSSLVFRMEETLKTSQFSMK